MEPVPTSPAIDLKEWGFDPLPDIVNSILTDAVRRTLEEDPPRLSLPYTYSDSDGRYGPCPDDPVMIYLDLPLRGSEDESVCWQISLAALTEDIIEDHIADTGYVDDEEGVAVCRNIAARLRELADQLEAACKPHVEPGGENVDRNV